jgi:hypothetical protein
MAYLKQTESGDTKLCLPSARTELFVHDEVVITSPSGVYRLLPFEMTDTTLSLERVDVPTDSVITMTLRAFAVQFGESIRVTAAPC